MKFIFILSLILSFAFANTNTTNTNTTQTTNTTKPTPNTNTNTNTTKPNVTEVKLNTNLYTKKDYNASSFPYIRAAHPKVAGVTNNNREGEVFNFCGAPNGFDIQDFTKPCFYEGYLWSIFLPTLIIGIITIVFLIGAIVFISVRKKCGGCCHATTGCICKGSRKTYEKKDWWIFFIITIVLVACLQLPFFLVGLVGNNTMTVALKDVAKGVLDVTVEFDGLSSVARNAMGKINHTATEEYEKVKNANKTNVNTTVAQSGDNMLKTVESVLNDVVDLLLTGGDAISLYLNWFLIGREVIFDVVLILPLLGSVVMIISAIFKISVLAWIFFPFTLVFSFLCLIFIAVEFPMGTIIADVCVVYYYAENLVDYSKTADIAHGEKLNFTNMTTEDVMTEVVKIPIKCNESLFNNMTYVTNGLIDLLYDTMVAGKNMSFLDEIDKVCNGSTVKGIFYEFNSNFTCNHTTTKEDKFKCIYKLTNQTLVEEITNTKSFEYDPLIKCGKKAPNNITNKLEDMVDTLEDIPYLGLNVPRVYWVRTEKYLELVAQDAVEETKKQLSKLGDLIVDGVKQLLGSIIPDGGLDLNLKLSSRPESSMKGYKNVSELTENFYCADLDGYVYEWNNSTQNYTRTGTNLFPENITDVFQAIDAVSNTYFMTRIECAPSVVIDVVKCKNGTECPKMLSTLLTPLAEGPVADSINFLKSTFGFIRGIMDLVDKMDDIFNCKMMNRLSSTFKETICHGFLQSELTLVIGLIGYGIVLWVLFMFFMVAQKRFNRLNYKLVGGSDKSSSSSSSEEKKEVEMDEEK